MQHSQIHGDHENIHISNFTGEKEAATSLHIPSGNCLLMRSSEANEGVVLLSLCVYDCSIFDLAV
jgi:hypothetical protein